MKNAIKYILLLLCALPITVQAQTDSTGVDTTTTEYSGKILDEIVAIVGDNYILKSDIDKEFETLEEQSGADFTSEDKYTILNSLIAKKILLYQAQLDSIVIAPERVDSEIDRRMQYILSQFPGGEQDFIKYIGKSIEEFKAQTRERLYTEMLVQEMQQKIIKDIKITPTEVKKYFNNIPKDSLPPIDAEVVVGQIVSKPKITEAEKEYARKKIETLREDILEGADFGFTAELESDDLGSATRGGETGFFGRGQMVPEFEAMAFRLKSDTVSKVIETGFGFHILQLIERRGEKVNVRHILKRPKTVAYDLVLARDLLDTLLISIKEGRISFEKAASLYSDDERTGGNGGVFADGLGNTKIPLTELPKDVFTAVNQMKVGDMRGPEYAKMPDGTDCYKIYYLIAITEPHVANLEQDWVKIQNAALEKKKADALEIWIAKHKKEFYIKIMDRYAGNPTLQHWIQN